MPFAAIFLGGVLGTLARAGTAELLPHAPGAFPWSTLAVNVLAAGLLGTVAARAPARAHPLLATGLCGALSTFSNLQLDLFVLLDEGRPGLALVYGATTLAAGLLALKATRR